MKELAGSPIDDNSYELWVLQGLRALLGDDKAQVAMVDLQSKNAAACEQIMAEAQARHDALSPEQKEDPSKILSQIVASSANLKFKMLVKAAPKGILTLILNLPKIIFISIPKLPKVILKLMYIAISKVLKSLFVKQR